MQPMFPIREGEDGKWYVQCPHDFEIDFPGQGSAQQFADALTLKTFEQAEKENRGHGKLLNIFGDPLYLDPNSVPD